MQNRNKVGTEKERYFLSDEQTAIGMSERRRMDDATQKQYAIKN